MEKANARVRFIIGFLWDDRTADRGDDFILAWRWMRANITWVAFSIKWSAAACFFSLWLHSLMQQPCYFFPPPFKWLWHKRVCTWSLQSAQQKGSEWKISWTKCTVFLYSKHSNNTQGARSAYTTSPVTGICSPAESLPKRSRHRDL